MPDPYVSTLCDLVDEIRHLRSWSQLAAAGIRARIAVETAAPPGTPRHVIAEAIDGVAAFLKEHRRPSLVEAVDEAARILKGRLGE